MTSLRVLDTNLANQLEVRQGEIEKLKTAAAAAPSPSTMPEVQIRTANANLLKGPEIERSRVTHHDCATKEESCRPRSRQSLSQSIGSADLGTGGRRRSSRKRNSSFDALRGQQQLCDYLQKGELKKVVQEGADLRSRIQLVTSERGPGPIPARRA